MSFRTSLDVVLSNHAVGINTLAWPQGKSRTETEAWKELLDDLIAAIPQPSREALEKILFPHATPQVPSLQENWLIEKVMAWATGQREWTWCECWEDKWKPGLAIPCESLHPPICAQCHRPLCAAPRPKDA